MREKQSQKNADPQNENFNIFIILPYRYRIPYRGNREKELESYNIQISRKKNTIQQPPESFYEWKPDSRR